ncbi:hypothetical protein JRC04_21610 [Mycolicibacterium sp. S2-37]|uniref:hypothetical protein n=1 Tax=Mycolicibacterium sp. S2-37 TaxID=2810297 RepID=UPI001A93E358|nr:hypothetical protein [Mycolicibacterium sp. S2-37]MBO0680071.1 hypothetical protein [Mycolicibacterium sp. S2-37]
MVIAAALCLIAAAAVGGTGVWLVTRPHSDDPVRQSLRAVAPTQFAAAVMLAAGGAVALSAPRVTAILAVAAGVIGAVGTVAAGCWQSAKAITRAGQISAAADAATAAGDDGCAGSCASCVLSCR